MSVHKHIHPALQRWLLLSAFGLGLAACAGMSDEMESYQVATLRYEQALRWQDYDGVVSFHKNEIADISPQKLKRLKSYKVTAYKVVSSIVAPDMQHATQTVEIKYFNSDYQLVHDLTLHNRWEFDPKKNRWLLLNPLPAFK